MSKGGAGWLVYRAAGERKKQCGEGIKFRGLESGWACTARRRLPASSAQPCASSAAAALPPWHFFSPISGALSLRLQAKGA